MEGKRPKAEGPYTVLYESQAAGLSSARASALEMSAYTLLTRFAKSDGECFLSVEYAEKVLGRRRQCIESALKSLTKKTFQTVDGRSIPVLTKTGSGRHGKCATYRDNLLLYAAGEMDSLPHIGQQNETGDAMNPLHTGAMNPLHKGNVPIALYNYYKSNKKRDGADAHALGGRGAAAADGNPPEDPLAEYGDEELLAMFRDLADDPARRIDATKRRMFGALESRLRETVGDAAVDAVLSEYAPPRLEDREGKGGDRP